LREKKSVKQEIATEKTPLYNSDDSSGNSGSDALAATNAKSDSDINDKNSASAALPHAEVKISYCRSWQLYITHAVFMPSLAYCLLYISLLSFGGMMVSYLSSSSINLSPTLLAAGRGGAALVGILATLATPSMMNCNGLVRAGVIAIWLQVICLVPCVIAFLPSDTSSGIGGGGGSAIDGWSREQFLIVIFISLITSRFGLWSFDLIETQLMQDGIREYIGAINGTQESLMNIMFLASFVITMIWNDPNDFAYPVYISFACVAIAAILYTIWACTKRSSSFIVSTS
jgi:iron-regulated transporter 1